MCGTLGNFAEEISNWESDFSEEFQPIHRHEKFYHRWVCTTLRSNLKFTTFSEPKFGNGYVDFCVMSKDRPIAIELKLDSNPSYIKAPETQLKEYMRRMKAQFGIYFLIIHKKKRKTLETIRAEIEAGIKPEKGISIHLVFADVRKKVDPSKKYKEKKI